MFEVVYAYNHVDISVGKPISYDNHAGFHA